MKHIKLYEQFKIDEDGIKKMLNISQQKGDIEIKTSVDNVIDNIKHYHPKIGTFKSFIISENDFFSEGDKGRINEYIEEFKKLGIDVSELEELKPYFDQMLGIERGLDVYGHEDEEYSDLVQQEEEIQNEYEQFIKELFVLRKDAKKILYPNL